MDWGTIVTSLGSAASGGILGIAGSLIGFIGNYFKSKLEHKQKLDLMEMELKVKAQAGSWEGLRTSLQAESNIGQTYLWVNAVRGLYRPVLTTLLVIMSYVLFRDIIAAIGDKESLLTTVMTKIEIKDLLRYIVYSLVFSASTAIVWWFGDRSFTPPRIKDNNK